MKGRRSAALLPAIADAVFPGRCLVCGEWLEGAGGQVCEACADDLAPLSGPRCTVCGMPLISERGTCLRCRERSFAFGQSFSLFPFEGTIRDLIHQYKFSGRVRLAGFFSDLLAAGAAERLDGAVVVPVPPRPGKRTDNVGLIARRLHQRHGILVQSIMVRSGGASQKSLDFEERQRNLLGAFGVKRGVTPPPRALLLDDVFTTGATLDACARALKDAGTESVDALTIAIDM